MEFDLEYNGERPHLIIPEYGRHIQKLVDHCITIEDVEERLATLIKDTIHKKGNLIIPSFAVERLQTLMYILWKLYKANKIPNIPIFIDSPMGNNVLDVFLFFLT